MKKILLPVLLSLVASEVLHAQGVMPGPGPTGIMGPTCRDQQNFSVLSEPLLKLFQINLMPLLCGEKSLYRDVFAVPIANYIHNRAYCEEIALCSSHVTDAEIKEADKLINDNLYNAVLIGALTKEIAEHRQYNIALFNYEKKHKMKVCQEEVSDFDCNNKLRNSLATVADSLVDFPEFDQAPASRDNLEKFIFKKFFSVDSKVKVVEKSLEDLKKNCSQKLNIQRVCSRASERLLQVKSCEKDFSAKNCFENEQGAWASLTNDYKVSNKSLFLAIEKQLCLPSRISKSPNQTVTSFSQSIERKREKSNVIVIAGLRSQQMAYMANQKAEGSRDQDETENDNIKSPDASDAKRPEGLTLDPELGQTPKVQSSDAAQGFSDSTSLSESFSKSLDQAAGSDKAEMSSMAGNNNGSTWNADVINRARDLAEEQRVIAEEQKRHDEEDSSEYLAQMDKKKKEEIDALMSQINGLKSKLDDMNAKVEELKTKKATGEASAEEEKESLERKASILELKKKIAELEADKKKKEAEAKTALEEEARLARSREEKSRSTFTAPASFVSRSSYSKNTTEHTTEAQGERERDKVASSIGNSNASENGRAPASFGGGISVGGAISSQIILKGVGTQATPDSNVVYMTPNELQHYPYRLGDNASTVEIEKMLETHHGSAIILGESEQIVPIVENGEVALDEHGKIKYKRIKISLVKNDKEKKQQLAREISSIADLKREEQRKRDLIRYQEMKKSLKLK